MPGFTADIGLLDIGRLKTNETVVVAAASGATRLVVGKVFKPNGCTLFGIAGGAGKRNVLADVLGFDVCINHHSTNFSALVRVT